MMCVNMIDTSFSYCMIFFHSSQILVLSNVASGEAPLCGKNRLHLVPINIALVGSAQWWLQKIWSREARN